MACALLPRLLLLTALAAPSHGHHLSPTSRLRYSRFLDPSNVVFLRWDFDLEAEIITFELQVRTAGWVGLGVRSRYTSVGSDLVVGGVLPDGSVYFSVSLRVTFFQGRAEVQQGSESRKDPHFPKHPGTSPEHSLATEMVHWRASV